VSVVSGGLGLERQPCQRATGCNHSSSATVGARWHGFGAPSCCCCRGCFSRSPSVHLVRLGVVHANELGECCIAQTVVS
jgi:hypothetical protein